MAQFKERIIISIVGNMNVGKSTVFNLITGQKDKSIVDCTAGTTADAVVSFMEIHELGATKVIDTAGFDEKNILGEKKKEKTLKIIDNSDLILFVIKNNSNKLSIEEEFILNYIKENNKKFLVIYNDFTNSKTYNKLIDNESIILKCNDSTKQLDIIDFIVKNFKKKEVNIDFLPKINLENQYVLLVIPLDEESPKMRLLRPQAMAIERLMNVNAIPVIFKPNIKELKNNNKEEINKFKKILSDLKSNLKLIIIDSQVFKYINDYIPKDIYITSFSIIMTNFMSNGNIQSFIKGVEYLNNLKENDNVLIVEACKHDRKCNDIATVQLPKLLKDYCKKQININFNFGNTFPTENDLKQYKLVIMCGSCMIDKQEYNRRILLLEKLKINYTNYGIFFSYITNKDLLDEYIKIF